MPQLDKFAFSSQVFWLILLFLAGYFVFFHFVLPSLYATLKVRNRRFLSLWQKMNYYGSKKNRLIDFYRSFFTNFFTFQTSFLTRLAQERIATRSSYFNLLNSSSSWKESVALYHKVVHYTTLASVLLKKSAS